MTTVIHKVVMNPRPESPARPVINTAPTRSSLPLPGSQCRAGCRPVPAGRPGRGAAPDSPRCGLTHQEPAEQRDACRDCAAHRFFRRGPLEYLLNAATKPAQHIR
ncbi:hypothetical protein OOK27_32995 [Streptomyces canus]|uniref:hypothetical protein n=1 Tax=Streptomyces canus TaxID=58343 RepID=UPI00224E4716|nr:hypothetical protein [Streptomyces canus]MCX5258897.1 hypothetical protein [Streptomyces canus]